MTTARPKILVLGGGFAGLESAFYLRWKLGADANITLVSDKNYFLYKPNTIYIPFGLEPEKLQIGLDTPTRKKHITFIQGRAYEIDPDNKLVRVGDQKLSYDYLLVATGAGMRADEVPGLSEYAETIWTPHDMLELRVHFYDLVENANAGRHQNVLFLVPPNNKCSGPLYEMVFMLDTWLREKNVRDRVNITWSTYEQGFIQAFGPRLDTYVSQEFDKRGITGHTEYIVESVEKNRVNYSNGASLPYDLLISFPPYIASTAFPGLPVDERGFISTTLETRQVTEYSDIYAVGDAGDFPIKQAFLAFLQADAAAEHLASRLTNTAPDFVFEPMSMCVMEEFNKATFAQVPLVVNGNGGGVRNVEVNTDAKGVYRVGSSPIWRAGKWMLGLYLPWRFGAGNPFHAGLPWEGMEVGLNVMSRVLAR